MIITPPETAVAKPSRTRVTLTAAAHSLAGLLAFRARRAPAAPAVTCDGVTLSYGELVARVNAVAAELRSRGLGPGNFVGLAVERSLELPVALWGIVQAGAAYVPLDPAYPQARLDQMVAAARLATVVTTARHAGRFAGMGLILADEAGSLLEQPAPLPVAAPDDPLYGIFTSGSTGDPKAAGVYRRGFANLLEWYLREFSFTPADRTLVITSPAFDLTQKNLFAPLVTGGRLVLDTAAPYDLTRLAALVRDHAITVMNCTPSAFYPLVDAAAADGYAALASLRLVVLGGEPILADRLRDWLRHPACRAEVANTYGPTECTDICAFHRLDAGNLDAHPFVPLGREIPNVQVEILDDQLRPLPPGETGELCIAGAGVGSGYLHDPQRTAARFLTYPGGGAPLYRSGDLAVRHPDGLLEFRGRRDHQAKIRGFRVEPGEVETALARHPQVLAAVVLAVESAPGEHRLVAWIEPPAGGPPPAGAELQAWLAGRLPDHLVPRDIRFLAAFPLTPNGKVDRLALARMAAAPAPAAPTPAPLAASTAEQRVMEAWTEVLGHAPADPAANFFDLGATSIHLAVVHAKLRAAFQRDFPLTELFAHPTVRALAAFLAADSAAAPRPAAPAGRPADRARLQQQAFARFRKPLTR